MFQLYTHENEQYIDSAMRRLYEKVKANILFDLNRSVLIINLYLFVYKLHY